MAKFEEAWGERDTCFHCWGEDVVHVVAGLPAPDLFESAPDWVDFGGCVTGPDVANRWCRTCDTRWSSAAVIRDWAAAKLALGLDSDDDFAPFVSDRFELRLEVDTFPAEHDRSAVLQVWSVATHTDITFPTTVDDISMALSDLCDMTQVMCGLPSPFDPTSPRRTTT